MRQPLRSKNLNLIPILQTLLKEESVVKASEELHLTQSTVSGALAKLRDIFDDPILVRVGRSSQLTPKAHKMRGQVDVICKEIEYLFEADHFDPQFAEEYFVIAAPDHLVYLINRVLLEKLNKEAPGIKIKFLDVTRDLQECMNERSIDLAICGDFDLWPNLEKEFLFREQHFAVVANDHPILKQSQVSAEDLREYPGLHYDPSFAHIPNKYTDPVLTGFSIIDWEPQITATQFFDSLLLAAETQAIARVPSTLFEKVSKYLPLTKVNLTDPPQEHDTAIFWSKNVERSEARDWLRGVIKECLADLM
jgi:DNA-binding transcriptional LysR family regulator